LIHFYKRRKWADPDFRHAGTAEAEEDVVAAEEASLPAVEAGSLQAAEEGVAADEAGHVAAAEEAEEEEAVEEWAAERRSS